MAGTWRPTASASWVSLITIGHRSLTVTVTYPDTDSNSYFLFNQNLFSIQSKWQLLLFILKLYSFICVCLCEYVCETVCAPVHTCVYMHECIGIMGFLCHNTHVEGRRPFLWQSVCLSTMSPRRQTQAVRTAWQSSCWPKVDDFWPTQPLSDN